jgi:phage antirepressor YoqD-like protein
MIAKNDDEKNKRENMHETNLHIIHVKASAQEKNVNGTEVKNSKTTPWGRRWSRANNSL